MKKDNLDKPVYETPKVSKLDPHDEAQGQGTLCLPTGSGATECQAGPGAIVIPDTPI